MKLLLDLILSPPHTWAHASNISDKMQPSSSQYTDKYFSGFLIRLQQEEKTLYLSSRYISCLILVLSVRCPSSSSSSSSSPLSSLQATNNVKLHIATYCSGVGNIMTQCCVDAGINLPTLQYLSFFTDITKHHIWSPSLCGIWFNLSRF